MEIRTLSSALKLYLRTLKEPIFTFKLHNRFIESASKFLTKAHFILIRIDYFSVIDDKADRIRTLHDLLKDLPKANYDLLHILMAHLNK